MIVNKGCPYRFNIPAFSRDFAKPKQLFCYPDRRAVFRDFEIFFHYIFLKDHSYLLGPAALSFKCTGMGYHFRSFDAHCPVKVLDQMVKSPCMVVMPMRKNYDIRAIYIYTHYLRILHKYIRIARIEKNFLAI